MPNREERRRKERLERLERNKSKGRISRRTKRDSILSTVSIIIFTLFAIGYILVISSLIYSGYVDKNTNLNNVEKKIEVKPLHINPIPKDNEIEEETNISSSNLTESSPYYVNLSGTYENNLYWLSKIIYAEAGSSYCSDEMQWMVGSVVLNRVSSETYPNSIEEVIFDEGQYTPVKNGSIFDIEPDDRTIENTKLILEKGPVNYESIYQANFPQGDIIDLILPIYINGEYVNDMYFCH